MGQFGEYVKMALYNIRENKGRSFLTMLGIMIGISSVIVIVSIGNGLKADVMETGNAKSVSVMADPEETTNTELITWEDVQALEDGLGEETLGISSLEQVMGSIDTNKGRFDAYGILTIPGEENDPAQLPVIRGEYLSEDDVKNAASVCVLDKASALYLFGNIDVVGMELDMEIGNTVQTFWVKGVRDGDPETMAANEEAMQMFGMEMPVMLEIPYTTAQNWGEPAGNFSSVTIYLADGTEENTVAQSAVRILDSRHRSEGNNLFIKQQSTEAMVNAMGTILDAVTAFIAFVAGISLLVGGIGVMNIMLVSVTERTREIGIRKALGARVSSIITQFLCESAIISGIGGVIGIGIGAGISGLVSALGIGGLSARLSVATVVLTTCFSCGVGILFGIYPAKKAAQMKPIEALRQL